MTAVGHEPGTSSPAQTVRAATAASRLRVDVGASAVLVPPVGADGDWFDAAEHLGRRGWKYLTPATRYLLAAAAGAVGRGADGALLAPAPQERLGVVAATSTAIDSIHHRIVAALDDGGLSALSPAELPGFSVNIPASQLAIGLGAKALSMTLTNPVVAGLEAVIAGARAIADGRADVVVAGACEDGVGERGPRGAAALVLRATSPVTSLEAPRRQITGGLSRFLPRDDRHGPREAALADLGTEIRALVDDTARPGPLSCVVAGDVPADAIALCAGWGPRSTVLAPLAPFAADGNVTGLRELDRLLKHDGDFVLVVFSRRGHVVAVTGCGVGPATSVAVPERRSGGAAANGATAPDGATVAPADVMQAARAQRGGRAPYGVRIVAGRTRLDPDAGPTLLRIYRCFARGSGLREIADELTRDGCARPGSNRVDEEQRCVWSKSAVRAVLVNGRYREDCAGLIDADTIRRVDERFARRQHEVARLEPRRYLLRGLVRCCDCRRLMQGSWNNGQPYYRCRHGADSRPDDRRNTAYLRESAALAAIVRWPALAGARRQGVLRESDPDTCAALLRRLNVQLSFDPSSQLLRVRVARAGAPDSRADLCV